MKKLSFYIFCALLFEQPSYGMINSSSSDNKEVSVYNPSLKNLFLLSSPPSPSLQTSEEETEDISLEPQFPQKEKEEYPFEPLYRSPFQYGFPYQWERFVFFPNSEEEKEETLEEPYAQNKEEIPFLDFRPLQKNCSPFQKDGFQGASPSLRAARKLAQKRILARRAFHKKILFPSALSRKELLSFSQEARKKFIDAVGIYSLIFKVKRLKKCLDALILKFSKDSTFIDPIKNAWDFKKHIFKETITHEEKIKIRDLLITHFIKGHIPFLKGHFKYFCHYHENVTSVYFNLFKPELYNSSLFDSIIYSLKKDCERFQSHYIKGYALLEGGTIEMSQIPSKHFEEYKFIQEVWENIQHHNLCCRDPFLREALSSEEEYEL